MIKSYNRAWGILDLNEKKKFKLLVFFVTIGAIFEIISLGAIIPVLYSITNGDNNWFNFLIPKFIKTQQGTQIFLIACLILIYFLKTLYMTFLIWYQNKFSFGLMIKISNRLFKNYLTFDYEFIRKRKTSDLIRNITSEVSIFSSVIMGIITILSEGMLIFSVLIILLYMNPIGSLASIFILVSTGYYFTLFTKKYISLWGNQRHIFDTKKIKIILESFNGIREIKHYGKEDLFIEQYSTNNNQLIKPTQNQYTIQGLPRVFFEFIAVFACMFYLLVQLILDKDILLVIPQIGLLVASTFRLMPSFNKIISSLQNFRFADKVINNLCTEFEAIKDFKNIKDVKNDKSVLTFTDKIELKNLSYNYDAHTQIFDCANLTINSNEFIAITGESGVGKSTLIDLILGLIKPNQGAIYSDNLNINNNIYSWKKLIGYVPQSFHIFDESISYNICFEEVNIHNEERLNKVLQMSKLSKFVNKPHIGVDYKVGENGCNLSGGQKQRIAIARALYANAKFLILDEPTSALDSETENEFLESLVQLKSSITIILITHSSNSVKYCDRIFNIKNKGFYQEK